MHGNTIGQTTQVREVTVTRPGEGSRGCVTDVNASRIQKAARIDLLAMAAHGPHAIARSSILQSANPASSACRGLRSIVSMSVGLSLTESP